MRIIPALDYQAAATAKRRCTLLQAVTYREDVPVR